MYESQGIITLQDSQMDAMIKMGDGNPGALSTVMAIMAQGAKIDPKAWHPLAHVLHLDEMGIRGEKLWILYADVCGKNVGWLLVILRAVQLGIIPKGDVYAAISGSHGAHLALCNKRDTLLDAVNKKIPSFGTDWEF